MRLDQASYHHQLHNTKGNRKLYPLFIDSACNGLAIRLSNVQKDNKFVITDDTATKYETVFQAFKDLITTEDVEPMKIFSDLHDIWDKLLKGGKHGN